MEGIIKKQNKLLYKIKKNFKNNWKNALIAFGSVFLVAALGGILVNSDSVWFNGLVKPEFYPPNWLFSVMWSILYFLVGIGLFLILKNKPSKKLIYLYAINGFLNIFWNFVFFTLESAFLGAIVLVLLIIFAYYLLRELYKINKTSFYLTLPYFVWLFFAFLLNYSIYLLN
jgi:translocator protein